MSSLTQRPWDERASPRASSRPSFAADQLTIVRRVEGDSVTLVLSGEIDLQSVTALERELRDAERSMPRRVVLDLADLGFLDSTGIHLLIDAQMRAETDGHQLVLTRVPGHAARLFQLTGLTPRVTVEQLSDPDFPGRECPGSGYPGLYQLIAGEDYEVADLQAELALALGRRASV